jgi:predicted GNAT superfamily acetyltransferase
MNLSIRPLNTVDDFRACEALQQQVWAMPDNLEVVPLHLLVTVQRNGGLLLGAFDGDDLVGFVFGFPGVSSNGKLKHCSHLMGVASSHRSRGVGYKLKLAQRELVLDQGIDLITWTYDPLESRNAYLNIHKLGGVCRTYTRDYYGPLTDGLGAGLPSDRFQVEWWISTERVCRCLAGDSVSRLADPILQVNATTRTPEGYLMPGAISLRENARTIRFEIPADFQALKAAAPALALDWRLAVRRISEACFAAGYTVADFYHHRTQEGERGYYILQAD